MALRIIRRVLPRCFIRAPAPVHSVMHLPGVRYGAVE
jgi:hypothetical protein